MKTDRLSFSKDANSLKLKVDNIDIKPFAEMRSGLIKDGFIITMCQYNIKDVINQLCEDYGEEYLIAIIRDEK